MPLISKNESVEVNYFNDPKAFIEFSNDIDNVYERIDEYNRKEKCKILIVFDDKIADMPVVDNGFTWCTHKNIKKVSEPEN